MDEVAMRWGTWEELILGGAVLRHGTGAWNAVASELRARIPFLFTAEECEAKYEEDLQERFSGCHAWFEELRKQRVAELKRELEKSEDSIGSLQSKLESLSSERENNCNLEYSTSQTESHSPTENAGGIDSPSKEISKDGSSAESFTEETGRDWSPDFQIVASVSAQENNRNMDLSLDFGKDTDGKVSESWQVSFRKKRGKRKRRGCNEVKEGSVGESDMLSSAAFMDREESSGGCNQDVKLAREDSLRSVHVKDDNVDLAGIMDSVMEHKDVSVFKRRLESQKKAKYKKMIRQHVDFQTISSRIKGGSISSAKELFRDLLLLSNNALVFYPKNSPEHKSAISLRDVVNTTLRQNTQRSSGDDGGVLTVQLGKSMKQPTVRPCNQNSDGNSVVAKDVVAGSPVMKKGKKGCNAKLVEEPLVKKRGIGRPPMGDRRSGRRQQEIPNKGRKRTRRK